MIEHQLIVNARFRAEVLERILRVVRHRGFRVCSMLMNETAHSERITLHLTVCSERPIQLLYTQLSKLMDVDSVEIQYETSQLRA